LLDKVSLYHPEFNRDLINIAFAFSLEAHRNQTRLSGEPFIIHPLAVAHIVADLKMDENTIVASLLHDVLEDSEVTEEELKEKFGEEITNLVKGVTKLSRGFSYSSREEA